MTGANLKNDDSKAFAMNQSHVGFIIWVKHDPYLTRAEVHLWTAAILARFVLKTEAGMIRILF